MRILTCAAHAVLTLGILLGLSGMALADADFRYENAPAGMDSARVRFRLADRTVRPTITFRFTEGKSVAHTPSVGDVTVDAVFVPYAERGDYIKANGRVPTKTFKDICVSFPRFGISWYCLPNPEYYDVPIPPKTIYAWEHGFPDACRSELTLEARAEPSTGDVLWYLNGMFAGREKGAKAVRQVALKGITSSSMKETSIDDLSLEDTGPKFAIEWFRAEKPEGFTTLPPRGPQHAGSVLTAPGAKAELSLKPGLQTVAGIPVDVFPVAQSVDPSLHRTTCHQGDLFLNKYFTRSAFNVCPEFSQWSVPSAFYTHAWVLCADVPRKGHRARIGTHVTRFCNIGAQGLALGHAEPKDWEAKEVGRLEWTEGGERKSSPLLLVKVRLNIGNIIDLINNKPLYSGGINGYGKPYHRLDCVCPKVGDYMDFELNGSGEWDRPTSTQVFGVTLVEGAFGADMAQSEQGNIFAGDEKPETGVEVTAFRDGTSGSVDWRVYDDAFRPVAKGTLPFALAKKGDVANLKLDLAVGPLGWYGLEYTFRDASGEELYTHKGAFALLGPDTREAGFDSPYAGWPHNGRHNSNPDLKAISEMMWKLGLRKSWEPPNRSETEFPEYPITKSILLSAKPCALCSPEDLQKHFDGLVAEGRRTLEKYPHVSRVIQLLHECGGRELAGEMVFRPAVRGEYKGIEGNWMVYYCTEFCKRMRREFPDFEIQIGNGSSASEMIAHLCRNGFDLGLVQQLGIESKGFGTMPELNSNLEAPGMLWALRETGRRFGYTNYTMNACNEYVFRPERNVVEGCSYHQRMWVTDYYLRDYLISLGHGVRCISTAHLEDSKTNYYNTNWGAGCMCKAFPYSYPKRCFVAIATLTRVLDCVERYPRRVPTGEIATYALEWRRNRKVKDFAAALWTPRYRARLRVTYPKGTKVTHVASFGAETELAPAADGSVTVEIGPTATYLVTSAAATGAVVAEHLAEEIPDGFRTLAEVRGSTVKARELAVQDDKFPAVGSFANADVADPRFGTVLEARLQPRAKPLPEVVWEYEQLEFREPVGIDPRATDEIGVWVRGNGSFAGMGLELVDPANPRTATWVGFGAHNVICFHGWHLMRGKVSLRGPRDKWPAKLLVRTIQVGSSALALDPIEMRPVAEPVAIGPVVVRGLDGAEAAVAISPDEIVARETMDKMVGDKDLAGRQGGDAGKAAGAKDAPEKPAPAAKPAEPPKPSFSDDMRTFLTEEASLPGFAAELADRVNAAYRRDLAKSLTVRKGSGRFTSSDAALVAMSQFLFAGIPEIAPAKATELTDKIKAIREFSPEIRTSPFEFGMRTYDAKPPSSFVSCVRRGESGCHTFLFFNLGDAACTAGICLPGDMKGVKRLSDLVSGKSVKVGLMRFKVTVPAHGFAVMRSNSGFLKDGDDMSLGENEGLILED